MMRFKLGPVCFAILGAIALVFGSLEFVTGLPGVGGIEDIGWLTIPGDAWRGIILFFAGAFIAAGSFKLRNIHGLGKAVLGSIMLWIVAGCDIFARIMTPIFGEEGWANTPGGFLGVFESPYAPALFLLPFSLVIIYFIVKSRG